MEEITPEKIKDRLIEQHPDTRAVFLIGSMADGSFNKDSDIDIVWIKPHKLGYRRLMSLAGKLTSAAGREVQLIQFTMGDLRKHFNDYTTMAHSIKEGVQLYGKKDGKITEILEMDIGLPKEEWMRGWYKRWLVTVPVRVEI